MVFVSCSQTSPSPKGNRSDDLPSSLSYIHRKRHSDSSILDETPSTSTGSSPPPLIRKKSGELVKSSLKLNCLAQQQARSMPTTPTYKNVHFGQDVDVRYFNNRDKPTAVSAGASPILKSTSKKWSKSKFGNGAKFALQNDDMLIDDYISDESDDDDEDDDDDNDLMSDDEVIWDLQQLNFQKIKYNEKFQQKETIFLERINLDDESDYISGSIAAKNLSYQKDVHIRYTFDQWRTVIEIEAQFTKESTRILKRANYDRFTFKIPLKNFESLDQPTTRIFFCIRFRYGDHDEVWDNNNHKNYEILLTKTIRKRQNSKTKFSLNDYFSTNHHEQESTINDFQQQQQEKLSHHYASSGVNYLKDLDSYFNNYEGFDSPETPRALKTNDAPDFNDLYNFNDLSLSDMAASSTESKSLALNDLMNVTDSSKKMSMLSDDSNVNLMDYRTGNENLNSFNTVRSSNTIEPDKSRSLEEINHDSLKNAKLSSADPISKPSNPVTNSKPISSKKPPINSKSYQELLDSYCFFKSDEPTTISSYLNDTLGNR